MTLPAADSPVPGSGPASRRRPAVVTVACGLMFGVAGLDVVAAVVGMMLLGPIRDAVAGVEFDDPQMQQASEQIATFTVWAAGCGIVFNLLLSAAFVVLALFNLRGANGARITTWVLAGLALLCGVCGVTLQGVGGAAPGGSGDADQQKINEAVEAAVPSWYNTVNISLAVLSLLACVGIVVLLALPAANEFFRKPVPQWQPPAEYGDVGSPPSAELPGPALEQPPSREGADERPDSQPGTRSGDQPDERPPGGQPPSRPPGES